MEYLEPDSPDVENNNNKNDFEISKIIGHRWLKGKLQYNVVWKGLSSSNTSWINDSDLRCTNVIDAYVRSKTKTVKPKENVLSDIPTGANLTFLKGLKLYGHIAYKTKDDHGVVRTVSSDDAKKLYPVALLEYLEKAVTLPNAE